MQSAKTKASNARKSDANIVGHSSFDYKFDEKCADKDLRNYQL